MEKPQEKLTDKKLDKEMNPKAEAPKKADKAPEVSKEVKQEQKPEVRKESKAETKQEPKADAKTEAKAESKEQKKGEKKPIVKKDDAIAKGLSLRTSKKHCMYICSFIKNKSVEHALKELHDVIRMRKAIPFKGEIPHRRGKEIMSGRYPVKASKYFIYLLKALRGNALANGLDLEKTRIAEASASWASRPRKSGGMRFKRTNVILKAREISMLEAKK